MTKIAIVYYSSEQGVPGLQKRRRRLEDGSGPERARPQRRPEASPASRSRSLPAAYGHVRQLALVSFPAAIQSIPALAAADWAPRALSSRPVPRSGQRRDGIAKRNHRQPLAAAAAAS